MKYISLEQIRESLEVLVPFNPFFATTYLVLKKARLPVGSEMPFALDAANRRFLIDHFKVHPKSDHFFRVMRPSDKAKDWVRPNYASTGLQAINTQTFRSAFRHQPNAGTWGWAEDYVERLAERLPGRSGRKIPLFYLAAWLYRNEEWADDVARSDIVDHFIADYELTGKEICALFHTDVFPRLTEGQAFQDEPVDWHDILADYSSPEDVPQETGGILRHLESIGVGPVSVLAFTPGDRLNVITGDNGLGKTFLLDLAWWALTEDWAERRATPFGIKPYNRSLIRYLVAQSVENRPVTARYSYDDDDWYLEDNRPATSGLVVYARVDGSFAIWDPVNRSLANPQSAHSRWPGMKFTREEVWDGKPLQIEGLIRDWVKWQNSPDRYPVYQTFQAVLERIYPPDLGKLLIGEPVRVPGDSREIPALMHPYGKVPILFESAGLRRVITLAYLLAWVWEEHRIQASMRGKSEERQMVVLIDEVEAHLHPRWQRVILPALLGVSHKLSSEISAQWIISSHSPLVLASAESEWDLKSDRLFHLSLREDEDGEVDFRTIDFQRRGTVDSWLSSEVFEIEFPGSTGRERAIQEAIRVQMLHKPEEMDVKAATANLVENLAPEDPFWVRWIFFADEFGVRV